MKTFCSTARRALARALLCAVAFTAAAECAAQTTLKSLQFVPEDAVFYDASDSVSAFRYYVSAPAALTVQYEAHDGASVVLAAGGVTNAEAGAAQLNADDSEIVFTLPANSAYAVEIRVTKTGSTRTHTLTAVNALAFPPRHASALSADGELHVQWNAPAHDGGDAVTGYRVRWAASDDAENYLNTGGADGVEVSGGATAENYSISGLTNATEYAVEVAAVTAGATGVWSHPYAVTPGAGICARNTHVQNALLGVLRDSGEIQSSEGCADVTATHLSTVRELTITGKTSGQDVLVELRDGSFSGLPTLTFLSLESNALGILSARVFDELTALRTLHLSGNQLGAESIPALPGEIFSGLSALEVLHLNNNQFAEFPQGFFSGLQSLRELSLNANDHLHKLTPNMFADLSSLQLLSLTLNNRLAEVPPGVFNGLRALRELDMQKRDTTGAALRLQPGVFANLSALENLNLQNLRMGDAPVGLFSGLRMLQTLRLVNNGLRTLPAHGFADLSALQTLHLLTDNLLGDQYDTPLPINVFAGISDTAEITPPVPGKPRGLTAFSGNREIRVVWQTPVRAAEMVTYFVRWRPESASTFAPAAQRYVEGSESIATTIENLPDDSVYQIQVAAANSFAHGNFSSASQGTYTDATAPRMLTARGGDGTLTLAWNVPADNGRATINGYKIRWAKLPDETSYVNTGGAEGIDAPGGASAIAYTITGADAGATYAAEVAAHTDFSTGAWAAVRNIAQARADAPRDVRITAADAAVTLTWLPPAYSGGSAVSGYRYRWSNDADAEWESAGGEDGAGIAVTTDLLHAIDALQNGATYHVQIAAENAAGVSWSAGVTARPLAVPGRVAKPTLHTGDSLLRANWNAPDARGGVARGELRYSVRWRAAAAATFAAGNLANVPAGATALEIPNLQNQTEYAVQVRARSDGGDGAWSESALRIPSEFLVTVSGGSEESVTDAILIARYLLGLRGEALLAELTGAAQKESEINANLMRGVSDLALDVDGVTGITAADGILVARYLLGVRGESLTAGQTDSTPAEVTAQIEAVLPPPPQ